jgi:hypothetical protein
MTSKTMSKAVLAAALVGVVSAGKASQNTLPGCKFSWTTDAGETCDSIGQLWGVTAAQIEAWNAGVDCKTAFTGGQEICVALPDGASTRPGGATTASTTTPPTPKTTTSTTPPQTTTATGNDAHKPHQDGIAADCTTWYMPKAEDNLTNGCADIVKKFGTFTFADFLKWNPAIGVRGIFPSISHIDVQY